MDADAGWLDAVRKMEALVQKGMKERTAAVQVGQEMSLSPHALRNRFRRRLPDQKEKVYSQKREAHKRRSLKSKKLSFTVASDYVEMAITNLARIPPDDKNAISGLDIVAAWITQRKKEIMEGTWLK